MMRAYRRPPGRGAACSQGLHLDQGLLGADERAVLRDDPRDAAGPVGLDLVEELHRLDQADDLADG